MLFAASGCDSPICDAEELTEALAGARPGQTVQVGACRIEGSFVVPPGVTLSGMGIDRTVLTSSTPTVELAGDGSTLRDLRIETSGAHGVFSLASGATIELSDVEVEATVARAALGFEGVGRLTLRDVTLLGPIDTTEEANALSPLPEERTVSRYGLVLVNVTHAEITNLEVHGFGVAGLASWQSSWSWTGGSADANFGIGVWIGGGQASLEDVSVSETLSNVRVVSFGVVSGHGARVSSGRLEVRETSRGLGLLHDGGRASHTDLIGEGNVLGGLIGQAGVEMEILGHSRLALNTTFGVLANQATLVNIDGASVEGTHQSPTFTGIATSDVGDGVQIHGMPESLNLQGMSLVGNERAGLTIDLAEGSLVGARIAGISTSATSGRGFGAVAQNGVIPAGWDSGITRDATTAANDSAFSVPIDVIVGPTNLPPISLEDIVGPTNSRD